MLLGVMDLLFQMISIVFRFLWKDLDYLLLVNKCSDLQTSGVPEFGIAIIGWFGRKLSANGEVPPRPENEGLIDRGVFGQNHRFECVCWV